MITIKLCGGLGNTLFQWALGRAFQSRGLEVQWDRSLLDADRGRKYMLDQLGLNLKTCNGPGPGPTINEGSLRYNPMILETKGDANLVGYWQCERYFAHLPIRDELFGPKSGKPVLSMSAKSSEMAQKILALGDRSCFIHVRRTDNLRPDGIAVHGLISGPGSFYYERAMDIVRERVPRVQYFVFSDDAEWCKGNFAAFSSFTIVDCNPPSFTVDADHTLTRTETGREVQDLWLMSLCQHAIIANSSFSWWGCWLNQWEDHARWPISREYPEVAYADYPRVVIAPQEWFATDRLDSTDICPQRWERVSVK